MVDPRIADLVERTAALLVRAAGLRRVDVSLGIPSRGEWALAVFPAIHHGVAPFMPDVADTLTDEIRLIVEAAPHVYTVEAQGRSTRYGWPPSPRSARRSSRQTSSSARRTRTTRTPPRAPSPSGSGRRRSTPSTAAG